MTDASCDNFNVFSGPYNLDDFWIYPGDAQVDFGNLGTWTTDGIDIDIEYSGELDTGGIRGYDLSWNTTFQNEFEQAFPTGTSDLVGTADGFAVFPEYRMSFGAGLFGDNWTANYTGTFIDETTDRRRPCYLTDDCKAESVFYHNIVGTYTWENITFNLGIRNLSDEEAPRFHSAFNANTEPGTYDVVGRAWYTGVNISF